MFILTGIGDHMLDGKQRLLICLPARYGRLTILSFHETARIEFMSSSQIISELTPFIKKKVLQYNIHGNNLKKLKTKFEFELTKKQTAVWLGNHETVTSVSYLR